MENKIDTPNFLEVFTPQYVGESHIDDKGLMNLEILQNIEGEAAVLVDEHKTQWFCRDNHSIKSLKTCSHIPTELRIIGKLYTQ